MHRDCLYKGIWKSGEADEGYRIYAGQKGMTSAVGHEIDGVCHRLH